MTGIVSCPICGRIVKKRSGFRRIPDDTIDSYMCEKCGWFEDAGR